MVAQCPYGGELLHENAGGFVGKLVLEQVNRSKGAAPWALQVKKACWCHVLSGLLLLPRSTLDSFNRLYQNNKITLLV